MVVTNLSVLALDAGSADNTTLYVTITPPNAVAFPTPAERLEVDAQTQAAGVATGVVSNRAVSGYLLPGRTVLLPVGGQLYARGTPPLQLTVQADMRASQATLAAETMTIYTVDSFTNGLPEYIDSSYAASIAQCAVALVSLWNALSQPAPSSPPSSLRAVDLIQKALHVGDCRALYDKLTREANPPRDYGVQPDLATKEEQAQRDFELKSAEAPREPVDLFPR